MDQSRTFVLWIAGFTGVLLMYAAFKDKSPTSIIQGSLKKTGTGTTPSGSGGASNIVTPVAAAPGVGSGVASAGVTNIDGVYYIIDQYGNPVTQINSTYATSPATYIPPKSI